MTGRAIHHLQREYREIGESLGRLESLVAEQERARTWRAQDSEDFQWSLSNLGNLLERHIRKEEEVLFPELEAFLPRDAGPLNVLRGEHSDMHENLRLLRRAVLVSGSSGENPEGRSSVQHYGDLLAQLIRDHGYKEDRVLFPMIGRHLTPELDTKLLARMEEMDRTPVGTTDPSSDPPRLVMRGRRTAMAMDKQDLIERLKLEVQVIEMGGYSPSVREPRAELHIFRDSVSCPNLGLQEKVEPCTHCFLMDFVPQEHSEKDDACHYIPLNERGDTIKSLEASGDTTRTQATVLAWLKTKISELES